MNVDGRGVESKEGQSVEMQESCVCMCGGGGGEGGGRQAWRKVEKCENGEMQRIEMWRGKNKKQMWKGRGVERHSREGFPREGEGVGEPKCLFCPGT